LFVSVSSDCVFVKIITQCYVLSQIKSGKQSNLQGNKQVCKKNINLLTHSELIEDEEVNHWSKADSGAQELASEQILSQNK
jgi:hypothetical protein